MTGTFRESASETYQSASGRLTSEGHSSLNEDGTMRAQAANMQLALKAGSVVSALPLRFRE